MIQIPNEVLATYRDGEFTIEICKEELMGEEVYTAYLRRDGYGTKLSMVGVLVDDCSLEQYAEMVENLLEENEEQYDVEVF